MKNKKNALTDTIDTNYLYATTRLRALESKMIGQKDLKRMLEVKSPLESYKIINDVGIGNGIEIEEFERALENHLLESYELVSLVSHQSKISEIFRLKYDGHNIKVLIKSLQLNKLNKNILTCLGNVPIDKLTEEFNKRQLKSLNLHLSEATLQALDLFARNGNPQIVDIVIDKAVLESMFSLSSFFNNIFLNNLIKATIDLFNIRTTIRLKHTNSDLSVLNIMLVSNGCIDTNNIIDVFNKPVDTIHKFFLSTKYGDTLSAGFTSYKATNTLSVFEKSCDNFIINLLKEVKFIPFGLEPIICYVIAKENEIKVIRTVLSSKIANVPIEQISERLRNTYV